MAASTTSMEVIRVDGLSLAARSGSGHWFNMDNSVKGGGHDGAASPMEMVLAGLAGCTAMDVLSMLEKMRARALKMDASKIRQEHLARAGGVADDDA